MLCLGAVSIPLLVTTLVGNSSVVSAASVATEWNGSFAGKATSMSVIQRKIFEAALMILSAGKLANPKSLAGDRGRLSFRPLAAAVQAGL
jgi:hypothetical protein